MEYDVSNNTGPDIDYGQMTTQICFSFAAGTQCNVTHFISRRFYELELN